ncbi:MAG: ABC transporter substrate-binding protein [Nakamurella sp.]
MQTKRAWIVAVAVGAMALAGCASTSNSDAASDAGTSSESPSSSAPSESSSSEAGSSVAGSSEAGSSEAGSSAAGAGADCTLPDPVKVGVVFTLTGGGAQYGTTQKNGVELAADQLNAKGGVKYDVDVQDSQTDNKQAISIFESMIAAKDSVIIGPTLSDAAKQTDPIAQDAKQPVLGVSNTAAGITNIGNYIWRDSLTEAAVIPQTIDAAKTKYGLSHVVVMYANDDAFSEGGYDAFKDALAKSGIKTDKTLTFSKTDTDFRSLLTEAKASNPDALVVSSLIDAAVPIVTQARQLGMKMPIIGGNGFNSPALMKDAGSAAEGVVVGAAWNSASTDPASVSFMKDYQAKYGSAPDQFAAQAFTGMMIVDDAVRLGCSADRDSIIANFAKVKDLATPLGKFSFTDARDASHPAVVQIVKDGKFAVLK